MFRWDGKKPGSRIKKPATLRQNLRTSTYAHGNVPYSRKYRWERGWHGRMLSRKAINSESAAP